VNNDRVAVDQTVATMMPSCESISKQGAIDARKCVVEVCK
jgi:hypothetical protein